MATIELTDLAIAQANARDMVRTFHRMKQRQDERKPLNRVIVAIEREVERRHNNNEPYALSDWDVASFIKDALTLSMEQMAKEILGQGVVEGNAASL